ncbi:hypothetical protein ACFOON_13780 [Novosphingobium piscinae]|uniref:Terminase small subunit n=1 Tax=Novosphingobium piscinae TaxID=1507448 RepID=A0A7X1FXN8_9SPHN|nr:hypothetical protein [Novosphingobium piscinae]MBC2668916.1 hypothetical protein [Novosphingobium piscinae]
MIGPSATPPALETPVIDHTRPAAADQPAPEFVPVPRTCNRHDGWTAARQAGFIAALVQTGSVRAAAHAVNMAPEGAYQLRRHPRAASFRKAWEAALAAGVQRLEDIAMERALNGTEEPVYSYGKLVGTRIVHNDRLLMFLLRNRAPARFAASQTRVGLVTPSELKRLKKQWRKEWEAELRDPVSAEKVRQSIEDKLAQLRDSIIDRTSPRTALLYAQWQASNAEDARKGAHWWEEDGALYDDGTAPGDYAAVEDGSGG